MHSFDPFGGQPFTSAMARAGGVSRDQVRYWLAGGRLRVVLHRVYVDAAVPDSLDLRAAAAALVLPEHAVVSDRCAAWLLGVDVLDLEERDVVPPLEVVSIGGKDPTSRQGVLGGKRDLRADEVVRLPNGVRATGPLRTACDVGCLRGRYRAVAAIDAFRRTYGLTVADFDAILPRYRGRRGVIQLRELITLSTDRADSPPESWVRLMIHDDGLPVPEAQADVVVSGWGAGRLENAYPHLRIAVEYDGERFHSRTEDRERDDERRAALDAAGWIVLVLRRGDLAASQRGAWLRELDAAIAARSPEPTYKRRYARGPAGSSYRWRGRGWG